MKRLASVLAVASLVAGCGGGGENAAPEAMSDVEGTAAAATAGTDADRGTTAAPTGAGSAASAPAAAPAPTFREVTIPAGTTLRLELRSAVASNTSQVEDVVRAALREPVSVEGATVLPEGTEFVGTVTAAEQSGRVRGRARVAYRFDSLSYGGDRYDITAAPLAHEADANTREDATKVAIGTGAGAAIGALLGGGEGAAKGAAIGAAGGTGTVLATRGDEIRLAPGARVTTTLSAPLTIRVPAR